MRSDRGSGLSLWLGALTAVGLVGVVTVAGTLMAVLGGNLACLAPGGSAALAAPATTAAVKAIPPTRLRLYQQAGRRFDVEWAFLASIGYQECGHGACAHVYPSGCGGPMQIALVPESACSPGPGPTIWDRYKVDADGGGSNPFDPADAIFTAARMLRPVFGLRGGSYAAYHQTACNYYGSCADAAADYAAEVMARAVDYGFQGNGAPAPEGGLVAVAGTPGPSCGGDAAVDAGANGIVRIAKSQLGTPESPSGSNCNPYGPCEQWCSLFVAWVWKKAGVPMEGTTSAYGYSGSLYEWAQAHEGGPFKPRPPGESPLSTPQANGARVLAPGETPAPGDAVLYGSGPQASVHVGIVERVFGGGQITTIDGNFGDRVARNGPFLPSEATAYGMPGPIYGYARPPESSGSRR